ncbi:uncharacterized protein LOC111489610 [Cucurbita maxima]|uniref:Uncharacterized protein LOC111489610 n=1 Tax=Cucurbita maxima TaxID=3661 RepID=A0A6J1K325_CUCMA|nr:uncharacterized protein LOC111489610 [Cucurbita maxima]
MMCWFFFYCATFYRFIISKNWGNQYGSLHQEDQANRINQKGVWGLFVCTRKLTHLCRQIGPVLQVHKVAQCPLPPIHLTLLPVMLLLLPFSLPRLLVLMTF